MLLLSVIVCFYCPYFRKLTDSWQFPIPDSFPEKLPDPTYICLFFLLFTYFYGFILIIISSMHPLRFLWYGFWLPCGSHN